jgi:hypothetical protein
VQPEREASETVVVVVVWYVVCSSDDVDLQVICLICACVMYTCLCSQIPERAPLGDDVAEGSSGVEEPDKSKTAALKQASLAMLDNFVTEDEEDEVMLNPMLKQAGEAYGTELVSFAKGTAKDTAMGIVEESPLGLVTDLFQIGKNGTPIFSSGPSPAETMRDMREKKVRGIRVHSDLEVMFTGMAFIIR